MKLVKGRSSRFLRQEFPVLQRKLPTLWTNSYLVRTRGGASLSVVKQYSEQQKHVEEAIEEAKERCEAQKNVSIPHLSDSQASEQA